MTRVATESCVSTLRRQTEIRRQRLIDRWWIGLGKVRDKNSLTQTLSDWWGQQPSDVERRFYISLGDATSTTNVSWPQTRNAPYASAMFPSNFHYQARLCYLLCSRRYLRGEYSGHYVARKPQKYIHILVSAALIPSRALLSSIFHRGQQTRS